MQPILAQPFYQPYHQRRQTTHQRPYLSSAFYHDQSQTFSGNKLVYLIFAAMLSIGGCITCNIVKDAKEALKFKAQLAKIPKASLADSLFQYYNTGNTVENSVALEHIFSPEDNSNVSLEEKLHIAHQVLTEYKLEYDPDFPNAVYKFFERLIQDSDLDQDPSVPPLKPILKDILEYAPYDDENNAAVTNEVLPRSKTAP